MRQMSYLRMALLLFGIVGGLVLRGQAAGIDELVESDTLEQIATGFTFTEGPVWHPDGYLLFSDIPGNTIYKWLPDGGVETFRSPSGHSNGLIFDRQGRLIVCEHSNRRVSRTEPDGTIVTLASEYDGSRLNSPNDAVVKTDGSIYFTDPPFGLTSAYGIPGTQELPFEGVYRLSPDGETLELLEADIFPNGLAFSPDEKVLYVMAQQPNCMYAYDVQPDGLLANRRVLTELTAWPDGMKVDIRGNLYVTNNTSALQVYDSEGMHLGDIVMPEPASNCGFGGDDNRILFITSETSVYRIQTKVQGVLPAPADPEKARAVAPTPGTIVELSEASLLTWIVGETAVQHDVYFATDFNDVNNANVTDTTGIYRGRQNLVSYTLPEAPKLEQNYYWRIDEIKADDTIHRGDVWSFTTQEFLIVDDFEDYNDYEPYTIYLAWVDGYDNPANGSTAGYPNPGGAGEHFVETIIVHSGEQAMPLFYSNTDGATYSEAERTFAVPQDWTKAGIQTLVLYFHGSPENTGQLYVKVNGSKKDYKGNVGDIQRVQWKQWNIDLASLGVNLQNVTTLSIGIDGNGASGTLYFDDIRLYPPAP